MSPSAINARMAAQRNPSLTRRWTSGSGTRRRARRGGKNRPRPPAPFALRPLVPLQPDQKAVAQPHRERVPMKALPAPALILSPAQVGFRFFMIVLDPVAALGLLHQHGQGGTRTKRTLTA